MTSYGIETIAQFGWAFITLLTVLIMILTGFIRTAGHSKMRELEDQMKLNDELIAKLHETVVAIRATEPRDADWEHVFELETEIYQGLPRAHAQFPHLARMVLTDKYVVGGGPPDWWEERRQAALVVPDPPETCPVCHSEWIFDGQCMECEGKTLGFTREQYSAEMERIAAYKQRLLSDPLVNKEEIRHYIDKVNDRLPVTDRITAPRHSGPPNMVHHNSAGGYISPGGAGGYGSVNINGQ